LNPRTGAYFIFTSYGAWITLRLTVFSLAFLFLITVLCAAQVETQPQTSNGNDANPPAQQPADNAQQSPAQQTPANPPAPSPSQPGDKGKGDKDNKGQDQSEATSKDRLFFALPNFLTLENAGQIPPLTAGEKFKVVARGSFDYVQYVWYGFLAGISQAQNSEPGFGQGAAGYGKRYGAYFGDGTIENFMTGAVFPSILHQDPRYFQSGKGGFWHRTGYSVSRIFVTRTDSGGQQFNYSEIFGSAISAGISNYSYHPRSDRNIGNTASVWGTQVGYDTITIVVKEFWPDIRRKLKKKHETRN
jgi:hypothetical protein